MGIVLGAGGIMVISEDVVRGWTEIMIGFMLRMVVRNCSGLFRGGKAHEGASRCLSGGYLGSIID